MGPARCTMKICWTRSQGALHHAERVGLGTSPFPTLRLIGFLGRWTKYRLTWKFLKWKLLTWKKLSLRKVKFLLQRHFDSKKQRPNITNDIGNCKEWNYRKLALGRRRRHPTPVLLPGKPHGQRSLVGFSPWGRQESDTTEQLPFHFSPSCIWEGNGNPLQCSCLENPRDRGAWWTAIYGVAESDTTEVT